MLSFYQDLTNAPAVPEPVEVMYPHLSADAWKTMKRFYHKFYGNTAKRTFLIGINPGRFGAGTTGVPFTDPIRLRQVCGIDHDFDELPELSSKFIYQMIEAYGGVNDFYNDFYITSVSPLGFTQNGKNLNYYDLKQIQESWESFMVDCLKKQITFGAKGRAFSLGQGKNQKYLEYLNARHQLFEEIIPLPHPRWVMQYRLKRLEEFVTLYCSELRSNHH
ncbi:MAG: hypothetical protein DHS20C17_07540 [Cyclobacteriaceae bacterium]|nr:MAG: hypothetical protein DHS20C17_07540 [Cyclobacteriaceae bacterium]